MSLLKTCKTCELERSAGDFYRNATYLDGLDSTCKECKREYQRGWREKHREEHRAYSRDYQPSHAEQRSSYYSGWRERNAEGRAEYDQRWRNDHPERMLARRKLDNARRRARVVSAGGNFTVDEWLALKAKYGGRCLACGQSEPAVKITPDHVIPLALGGSNSIENIQPLCWGCNATKQAKVMDYREL